MIFLVTLWFHKDCTARIPKGYGAIFPPRATRKFELQRVLEYILYRPPPNFRLFVFTFEHFGDFCVICEVADLYVFD